MADEPFFDIKTLRPSRNVSSCPWMTQNDTNVRQEQPWFVDSHVVNKNINGGQNVTVPASSELPSPMSIYNYQAGRNEQAANIDTWDPMDDDFACPAFNSYKDFDVLNAERPSEKSPEKSIRQSPEKRAEEVSLYVCNIPLSITNEGIKNLFLSVGDVQYCKILPPKDPSIDTKYGFVKFCTWREAIKAIETYDGLYVGGEKNLQVRVAYQRRGSADDYMPIPDEDSSSEGSSQDKNTNSHPPFESSNDFDDKVMNDQILNMLQDDGPVVMDRSQGPQTEVNFIKREQNLSMSPGTENVENEQTVSEKLPNEFNHSSPAMPRKEYPCTNCEKLCTQRCSACKAPYCSRQCQKIDRRRHKLVCTYQSDKKKTKPANSSPPAVRGPEPVYEPEIDSDFDCIDISLDINRPIGKDVSKKKIENVAQSPDRNVTRDSGYTSQKDDMRTNTCCEGVHSSSNTGTSIRQDEIVNSDAPDTPSLFENMFMAYVTAVPSANAIWAVVRSPDYPRFCALTDQMTEMTEESLKRITSVTFGSLCLTRFSVDKCWYRSKIVGGNEEQVEVFFVDYGNTEWKSVHDLYQLPQEFWDVPPQAQKFSLHRVRVPSHPEVERDMIKFLGNLVCDRMFHVELVQRASDCVPEVILKGNGAQESINQQMINYLEQIAPNVASDRSRPNQTIEPSIDADMATHWRKPSETQYVNGNYLQGVPNNNLRASNNPATTYTTPSVSDPTAGCFSGNVSKNDAMAAYDSHNAPVTTCVPANTFAHGACDAPTNHQVTGNLPSVPVKNPVSKNNMTTSYSSAGVSYGNPPMTSNVGSNPPRHSTTSSLVSDPVTSNASGHFCSTPNVVPKSHMASEVPSDSLPSTETFGILVCHLITPASFWIWFLDTVKSLFSRLTSMLSETYEQSAYTDYVPVIGELIAAKYTDGVWYRAKLDCINDDNTLEVTFIDFGNSESVSLYDTRRITDDLANIPKLATKCALYGMEEPARKWSAECIKFCNGLMLNKRGSAVVQGQVQDSLLLKVVMDVNGEMRSVVDEIVKQGYFISKKLDRKDSHQCVALKETDTPFDDKPPLTEPVSDGNLSVFPDNRPNLPHPSQAVPSMPKIDSPNIKPPLPYPQSTLPYTKPPALSNQSLRLYQPSQPRANPLLSSNVASTINLASVPSQPTPPGNQSVFPDLNPPQLPESKPVNANKNPVVNPQPKHVESHYSTSKPVLSFPATEDSPPVPSVPSYPAYQTNTHPGEKVDWNYKTLLPRPVVPATAFNVIVNDVLSADKFHVQMIDPNLVSQLKKCVRELNEYVTKTRPTKVENVVIGSLGCAQFAHVWYRSQVVEIKGGKYRVCFIDFGNSQYVYPDEFLEAPDFFYRLAPQALSCRLGTSDHIWGKLSQNMMETLTLNKQLLCTVVGGTSWPHYAVKLQDSVNGEITDIAEELTKGMAVHPSNAPSARSSTTPSPSSTRTTFGKPASGKRKGNVFTEKVLSPGIFSCGIAEVGETYKVKVATVFHPTYFWVQPADNVENIKRFQEKLSDHYNNNSYPPYKPLLHSFCVYIWDNHCLRVFVKQATAKGLIVHSVDFGFTLRAEEKFLRPLESKFCSQPFGAVLCSMAEVLPADGNLWNEDALKYFRNKVSSNVVKIRVVFNSKARLFVDVFDPDSSEDCSLATALIANGLANNGPFAKHQFAENVADLEDDLTKPAQSESTSMIDETFLFSSARGNFGQQTSSHNNRLQYRTDSTDSSDNVGDIVNGQGYKHIPGSHPQNPCPTSNLARQTSPDQNQGLCFNVHHNSGVNTNVMHSNTMVLQNAQSFMSKNQVSPSSGSGAQTYKPIPVVVPTENKLQVFVSWIDSPDSFYAKLAVKETVQEYEAMGEQLHQTCENTNESVNSAEFEVGDFCASKFAGEWCRCRVEALLGNGLARVFYVDFGNREDVQLVMLKSLTKEFRVLPAQALQCALADVRRQERDWTPQVVQWLRDSILNKIVEAAVVERIGDVLHVCVYDKFVSNTSINSLMIQAEV